MAVVQRQDPGGREVDWQLDPDGGAVDSWLDPGGGGGRLAVFADSPLAGSRRREGGMVEFGTGGGRDGVRGQWGRCFFSLDRKSVV